MNVLVFFLLIIVGYFIFKSFTKPKHRKPNSSEYRIRKTGRRVQTQQDTQSSSFIQSAKRQETLGNFDEASRLYLKAGHVFSSAKMKAMKGPQAAKDAIDVIRVNSPDRTELITRNLANDFFYRLEQPATAASLLRNLGLHEEATAVEVAAGISNTKTHSESVRTASSIQRNSVVEPQLIHEEDEEKEPELIPQSEINKVDAEIEEEIGDFPNTLMMASSQLDRNCSACKREIKSGDSFIYCINCGYPGHYKHLGEMIKVTGKCPVCKKRLVSTMYDII